MGSASSHGKHGFGWKIREDLLLIETSNHFTCILASHVSSSKVLVPKLCTKYAWTTCCNMKQCTRNNNNHYYYCCCYYYCYYYQGDQVVLIARSKHPPWGSKLLVIRIANILLHRPFGIIALSSKKKILQAFF